MLPLVLKPFISSLLTAIPILPLTSTRLSPHALQLHFALTYNLPCPIICNTITEVYTVYCKIKLPKVAKQKWTLLQVQIGQSCKGCI